MAKVQVLRDVALDTGEIVRQVEQVDLEDFIRENFSDDPGVGRAVLDANGHEVLNPVPMAPPVGYKKQPSLFEQVRDMVRQERRALEEMEPETFEESDDFDVDEDPQPVSRWENDSDPSLRALRQRLHSEGYRYDPGLGEYVAPEAPAVPGEGGQGRRPPAGAAEPAEPLDGPRRASQSKKPRGGEPPAASQAPLPGVEE